MCFYFRYNENCCYFYMYEFENVTLISLQLKYIPRTSKHTLLFYVLLEFIGSPIESVLYCCRLSWRKILNCLITPCYAFTVYNLKTCQTYPMNIILSARHTRSAYAGIRTNQMSSKSSPHYSKFKHLSTPTLFNSTMGCLSVDTQG